MAEFVGSFAASHGPLIARDWERLPSALKTRLTGAFTALGKRVAAKNPDTLIVISPDHWVNFFLNNLPTICLGVGESHDGPPEPFMASFPYKTLAGHSGFANYALEAALENGFEPSVSHHLILDHGFCIPLGRMELPRMPKIVPLIVNDIEPPMMSIARCVQWGRFLRDCIEAYPGSERIGILATGGLSHSIGEPTMGEIDEAFDRGCIAAFKNGDDRELVRFLDKALASTGNGAHELRNWTIAHAAAHGKDFNLIDYHPAPEVYIGCAFASWAA